MSSAGSVKIIPPHVLLGAYAEGVFPMGDNGEIVWFSPTMRGIIPLEEEPHWPHGLRKVLKKNPFDVRWSHDFRGTMQGCAERDKTWIDGPITESYCALNDLGYAHSVECYDDDGLQGGLYGVVLGRAFFGESMFSRKDNASKVALAHLVQELRRREFTLLDTQWLTPHLRSLGGVEITRNQYLARLQDALSDGYRDGFRPQRLGPE